MNPIKSQSIKVEIKAMVHVVLVDLNELTINLSKSAAFSLQRSENNLKPP